MASSSKNPEEKINEESYQFNEEINDQIDDLLEERGHKIPEMSTLLGDADLIEKAVGKEEVMSKKKLRAFKKKMKVEDDLTQDIKALGLEPDASTPKYVPPFKAKGKGKEKAKADDLLEAGPSDDKTDYQESFTSQQETAELRDDISSLSSRLANFEATIESLLNERKNLPIHIDSLRIDINEQFTVMNERLNAAIESGVITGVASQTADHLSSVVASADTVLATVHQELRDAPVSSSQITHNAPIKGQKKKIRLIK